MVGNVKKKNVLVIIFFLFLFASFTHAGIIDGGDFETGDPPDKWQAAVCGKVATPPINAAINRGGVGDWIRDGNGATNGSFAGLCSASTVAGQSGINDPPKFCLINNLTEIQECSANFTANAEPFPPETFIDVNFTTATDFGSDFNIMMAWADGTDRNFFSVRYLGDSSLSAGNIILLDITLCFAGGTNCNPSTVSPKGNFVSIDNVRVIGHTTVVTEPPEPIATDTSFEISAVVTDVNGTAIESAVVTFTALGDINTMAFSNGAYRLTFDTGLQTGNHAFTVTSSFEGFDLNTTGTLQVSPDLTTALIVTNIENTSINVDTNSVNVRHASFNKISTPFFTYQVENLLDEGFTVPYEATSDLLEAKTTSRTFTVFTSTSVGQPFQINDSLTFSINRLWNPTKEIYEHNFERTIDAFQTQQLKLDFKRPFIAFESLTEQNLFTIQGSILKVDIDNRSVDQISLNQYGRLQIKPTDEFATITSDDTPDVAYVVSFTASVDTGTIVINADDDSVTVDTVKRTHYLNVNGDFNITSETPITSQKLEIEFFVVSERGFFAEELEIFDEFGNDLPVQIDDTNTAVQVLEEGQRFSIDTAIYERGLFQNEDLDSIIIEAFVTDLDDVNRVLFKEIQIKQEDFENEVIIEINEVLEGIITTSTTLPTLTPLLIRVQACGKRVDVNATSEPVCFATQESQNLVLRQFPFSNDQLLIVLDIQEFFVGESPEGSIFLETNFPENIEYVVISVFQESGSVSNSDVNEFFFKDIDFSCIADFCSFGWRLNEWAFEEPVNYFVQATVKVRTQELDFESEFLNKILFLQAFTIDYKENFLNLYNLSRDARIYLDHENIPLILTLRDNLNLPSRDDLNVFFRVWDLGTTDFNGTGDAESTFEAVLFAWDVYEYDINSGSNKYAFVGRPRETGSALQDGHFYRFAAVVNDHTKKRTELDPITLSNGKATGGFDTDTNAFQQTNEVTIKIDNTVVLEVPLVDQNGWKALTCLDPQTRDAELQLRTDQLTSFLDAPTLSPFFPLSYVLKGGIRFASSVIGELFYKDCHVTWIDRGFYVDTIRVFVYNSYSDLTEQDPEFKQYMDFTISSDVIVLNDGKQAFNDLIQKSPSTCKTQFIDDSIGQALCALGTLGNGQTNELITAGGSIIDDIETFFAGTEDINKVATINPQTRYLKFQINNIKPKNVLDFQEVAEIDFSNVPDTKILRFLKRDNGLRIVNETSASIDIFQNGRKIKTIQLENNLYDRLVFDQFADANGFTLTPFEYFIRVDLCFNSGRNCLDPQILKFSEPVALKRPNKPLSVALGACFANFENFSECTLGFFSTPEVFIVSFGGVIIFLILIFIVVMIKSPEARSTVINVVRGRDRKGKGV
ncbi:hypothetical protein LCGC14_0700270 [marine sediment metagenome]|uniref:Uncharacterized protein n=1 Tax=marine sediment metagenome TaxID=412755 RepID=A0A0F9QI11_9ZZZZ